MVIINIIMRSQKVKVINIFCHMPTVIDYSKHIFNTKLLLVYFIEIY